MSLLTMFFVLVGVSVCTAALMRLVEWVDAVPEEAPRSVPQPVVLDFPCAELELESAQLAA